MPMSQKIPLTNQIGLYCGKRCLDYNSPRLEGAKPYDLGMGERLCFNRCRSKFYNVKEVMDDIIKD
eukprot:CAMPEP_0168612722 /NCGR_PEP_ID=MMETSP0449_2-20121227/3067_1 /TAXON_ID=1082188 /ORGANISM="Strombidium rassoulzadegani, Strain ras09" /LENGTH=65 /DNA_ID=CAMNT_0008653303 /DNA_START=207 /DNA_END=404 /DNA_ORIENTATION=+